MSLNTASGYKAIRKKNLLDLRRLKKSLKEEEKKLKTEIKQATVNKVSGNIKRLVEQQKTTLKLLTAYRFSGITVVESDEKHNIIYIDTAFNGVYYDQYQLHLEKKGAGWTVKNHTIPHFLPVVSFLSDHYDSPEELTEDVYKYLSIYTCRLGQVQEVQRAWTSDIISITATALLDFIRIYFAEGPQLVQGVSFDLKYNLVDELPTAVTYIIEKRSNERDTHKLDQVAISFETHTIKTVISEVFTSNSFQLTMTKSFFK